MKPHKSNTRQTRSQTSSEASKDETLITLSPSEQVTLDSGARVSADETVITESILKRIEKKLEKLHLLDTLSVSVDKMSSTIQKLDDKLREHEDKIRTVENALQHSTAELTDMKQELSTKASLQRITELEDKIEDLENRSRRNNIILYKVPECEDNPKECANFVKELISTFMEVKDEYGNAIEVERAHRGGNNKSDTPRPIYARILNWKNTQLLLRQTPKILKGKTYQGNKIFITDDVSLKERQKRKMLVPRMRELRKQGLFAIIPFKVPAVLVYKDKDDNFKTEFPNGKSH